jgi:calcineurin-like phosphoesterase family protein
VQDYAELTVDGHLLVLCHYPFRSWNGQHRRALNLHGHSHGKMKPLLRQHDVGVDARGYRPVALKDLLGRQIF